MKKTSALLIKDIRNALRNQLFQFMLISPIVMMIVFRILIPVLEDHTISFITDASVPEEIEYRLNLTSRVERVPTRDLLDERIQRDLGSVGLVFENNSFQLVFKGNEETSFRQRAFQLVMISVTDAEQAIDVDTVSLGIEKSGLHGFLSAILILLVGIWAGISMGLTIVYDKETGMIKAQAISPITILHYCSSKILFTTVYTILYGIIASWVMLGVSFPIDRIIMIVLSSTLLGVFMGIIVGWVADNQNTAIAAIKVLAFLFGLLPLVSMMVPQSWEWLFSILPSFWVFKTITQLVSGADGYHWSFLWAVLINGGAVALLIPLLTNKLGLRVR